MTSFFGRITGVRLGSCKNESKDSPPILVTKTVFTLISPLWTLRGPMVRGLLVTVFLKRSRAQEGVGEGDGLECLIQLQSRPLLRLLGLVRGDIDRCS